jgi:hypothetical protein
MKALVYLLAARALDVAREREEAHTRRPEEPLGPLATTEATAMAWRRWSQAGKTVARPTERSRRRPSEAPQTRPTSA